MTSGMYEGLGQVLKIGSLILCVSVPLGIWKLVDIIIWLCHHISIGLHWN